jgi:hypothetical protein
MNAIVASVPHASVGLTDPAALKQMSELRNDGFTSETPSSSAAEQRSSNRKNDSVILGMGNRAANPDRT